MCRSTCLSELLRPLIRADLLVAAHVVGWLDHHRVAAAALCSPPRGLPRESAAADGGQEGLDRQVTGTDASAAGSVRCGAWVVARPRSRSGSRSGRPATMYRYIRSLTARPRSVAGNRGSAAISPSRLLAPGSLVMAPPL